MGVVSALSERDRQLAEWFRRNGFLHPYLTVAALRKAAIKPQSAAALLQNESGGRHNGRTVSGGRNVFGCDWRQTGDNPPYCGHEVTLTRYRALRRQDKQNGVGPCQLTLFVFLTRADRAGGAHLPLPNMVTGFRILKENAKREGSVRDGARAYNGSGPDAEAYADRFMARRAAWERKLHAAGFNV